MALPKENCHRMWDVFKTYGCIKVFVTEPQRYSKYFRARVTTWFTKAYLYIDDENGFSFRIACERLGNHWVNWHEILFLHLLIFGIFASRHERSSARAAHVRSGALKSYRFKSRSCSHGSKGRCRALRH